MAEKIKSPNRLSRGRKKKSRNESKKGKGRCCMLRDAKYVIRACEQQLRPHGAINEVSGFPSACVRVCARVCTLVRNNQESGRQRCATRSSVCSFARIAHSFACLLAGSLLSLLRAARFVALIRWFGRSLTLKLVRKRRILCLNIMLF